MKFRLKKTIESVKHSIRQYFNCNNSQFRIMFDFQAFEIVGLICIQIGSAGILSSIVFTIATSIAFILTAILLVITMMTDDVYGVNLSSLQMYYSALVAVVFIVTASLIVITINPLILTAAVSRFQNYLLSMSIRNIFFPFF